MPLWSLILSFSVSSIASLPGAAADEDPSVVVRALNPLDEVAVVQTSTGSLRTVRVGDVLDGFSAKVTKVLEDRLVLERLPGPSSDLATIWVYKAERRDSSGTPSKVVVFARRAPTQEVVTPAPSREAQESPAPASEREADEKGNSGENGSDRTRAKKKHR